MARRFGECRTEKNWSLIRYDILQSMRTVYDATQDESIRSTAEELLASETDEKYGKKYATLWRR
ncbi:hypothetical protein [Amycolatopsis aidingensis]|uniref:hypothetical protein n=1 Tax=Amycolatopsis aidingensis TaxID=2842453 RepID=UPI001C0DA60E|nr:hypothetical protein [Amycolatopsis aidingensis]